MQTSRNNAPQDVFSPPGYTSKLIFHWLAYLNVFYSSGSIWARGICKYLILAGKEANGNILTDFCRKFFSDWNLKDLKVE